MGNSQGRQRRALPGAWGTGLGPLPPIQEALAGVQAAATGAGRVPQHGKVSSPPWVWGAVSFFYSRSLTPQPGLAAKTFCLGEQACRMGYWLKQTLTRSV